MIHPADVQTVTRTLQQKHDPVLESTRIVDEIDNWMRNRIEGSQLERYRGLFLGATENVMHEYFVVDGSVLSGYPNGESIVVDPTVQQFSYSSWSAGAVDTYVADSARELPSLGVFTEQDPERDWYMWP